MTGILTASAICGTRTIVVSSPMCPPASMPSATTASAPCFSTRRACETDAMTGTTIVPSGFRRSSTFPGLPAPVVTIGSLCLAASSRASDAVGDISMMLSPKGRSVRPFALRIS